MYRLFFIALCAAAIRGEVIDRIAITVGSQVITELQIDEELRVSAFLNHQSITRDADTRRAAANRLVEQALVKHEMELSRYPALDARGVDDYLAQVRAGLANAAEFDQLLRAYDLNEPALREHVALQLTTLRFIEFRFRPDIGVSESDIQNYYDQQLGEWKVKHPRSAPPTLAASAQSIRNALVEARTDEVLDTWLAQTRKESKIVYLDKSLQ